MVDQLWEQYDPSAEEWLPIDRYLYAYEPAGNRVSKENVVAGALQTPVHLDERYYYDGVYRLIGTERGQLVDGEITTPDFYQDWTLDGLGNFAEFDDDGDAQTRAHNAANEIESLTPEGGQPVTMLHDAAGNLLDDGVLKYTYDAWNRQVAVRRATDDRLVAEYAFDGRGRRVEKSVFDGDEELLATTGYFHNHRWQVLEEHCLPAGEQEAVRTEYVWSATYIDSPIARFRDETEDADFDDPGETLYYAWDANRNVTALVGLVEVASQQFAWQPVERYVYDPYGRATVRDADWTIRPDGADENPTPGDESAFGNEILYCGYRYDPETALLSTEIAGATGNFQVRHRQYTPRLSQWTTRDPLGYAAGDVNLYRYVTNQPVLFVDPTGEQAAKWYGKFQITRQSMKGHETVTDILRGYRVTYDATGATPPRADRKYRIKLVQAIRMQGWAGTTPSFDYTRKGIQGATATGRISRETMYVGYHDTVPPGLGQAPSDFQSKGWILDAPQPRGGSGACDVVVCAVCESVPLVPGDENILGCVHFVWHNAGTGKSDDNWYEIVPPSGKIKYGPGRSAGPAPWVASVGPIGEAGIWQRAEQKWQEDRDEWLK